MEKVATYLLTTLIILLVVDFIALYMVWSSEKYRGLGAVLVLFAVNLAVMFIISRVKINDKTASSSEIAGDIIAVTMVLILLSVVGAIVVGLASYHNWGIKGIAVPMLTLAVFYMPLFIVAKT